MAKKGSAAYQAEMAKIDARQAAREKERKIQLLEDEAHYASDPEIKAEIEREIKEITDSA